MKQLHAMRRLISSVLAAALMMTMMVITVSADTTDAAAVYTLTLNQTVSGHTYTAYQVLSGTASDGTLTDIAIGEDMTGLEALLSALLADETIGTDFAGASTAAAIVDVIGSEDFTASDLIVFAEVAADCVSAEAAGTSLAVTEETTSFTMTLKAGYYLIVDAYTSSTTGENANDSLSRYLLVMVAGDTSITIKAVQPTIVKQIRHNELAGSEDDWGEVGDNQIGDTVEFRTIISGIPDVSGYSAYTIQVFDSFSEGLESNVTSADDGSVIGLRIYTDADQTTELSSSYYTISVGEPEYEGYSFLVIIDVYSAENDGVLSAGDSLYLFYTGTLSSEALVSAEANAVQYQTNSTYMRYSNDPYDTTSLGKSEQQTVYDWTFQVSVTKVDAVSTATALTGAVFALSESADLGDLYVSDGTVTDSGSGSVIAEGNVYSEASGTCKDVTSSLIRLTAGSTGIYTVDDGTGTETTFLLSVDSTGDLTIRGLDDSTMYYLYEVTAPQGYSKIDGGIPFTITAGYSYTDETSSTTLETPGQLQTLSVSSEDTANVSDGDTSDTAFDVLNTNSSSLPSTGGAGTAGIYIAGALLVLFAGVSLAGTRIRRAV